MSIGVQERGRQWVKADNLLGADAQRVLRLVEARSQEIFCFSGLPIVRLPIVLLAESDPVAFLAGFIAACDAQCPVVLGNPNWTEAEWQQVFEQVQPDLCWGRSDLGHSNPASPWQPAKPGWILIPTGGSSGRVRFAIHTWQTLTAAVMGFQQYFECARVNSCCVLPLYHVSGLMQLMRSLLTHGKLAIVSSKSLELEAPPFDPSEFFLSLVPTQLQRLLQNPEAIAWLARVQTVLLGGAPAWDALLQTARRHQIRLAPTYGMTETASQVATLKPEAFLAGQTGCGLVLPHAKIEIQEGAIAIQATSLCLGYLEDGLKEGTPPIFKTDDLGYFDRAGYLHIVGRQSRKIITGGENVFPDEVEAAIRSTGLVTDVCVVGLPDRYWGEAVAAVYVSQNETALPALEAALDLKLSRFKQPKRWIAVAAIPRNAQGKVNYELVKTLGD